jgi:hypothetical protein
MRCLTDVEVQVVADEEGTEEMRVHAESCEPCRDRVTQRRALTASLSLVEDNDDMPPATRTRVRRAITTGSDVQGSTVLRSARPSPWRMRFAAACAAGAVIALVVFGVAPQLGAPTTLSASQILERSLQTISSGSGVEMLEYEVAMDGMTPGPVVIRQVIDRDNPNRYKVASYHPDGTIATSISQDPIAQRRSQLFHVDGTNYIVRVAGIHTPVLSVPQMAQALVETSIGIMQAKSDQQLTVEDGPDGRRYIIEIPPVTPASPVTTLDIFGARAVISGSDFRIQEFEATGTLLRQPFSISVKLRMHQVLGPSADNPSFEIDAAPGDVVLEGQAADDPITELMTTVLRELGRARGN